MVTRVGKNMREKMFVWLYLVEKKLVVSQNQDVHPMLYKYKK